MDHGDDSNTWVGWGVGITPVVAAIEAAGLYPIRDYIRRRKVTIAENLAYHPIYELCDEAERMPGMIRMRR